MGDVARLFPALEYLSMMRNPCCPEFFNITESRQEDYRRHREFVLSQLPAPQVCFHHRSQQCLRVSAPQCHHLGATS